jgi:hypothetical protein
MSDHYRNPGTIRLNLALTSLMLATAGTDLPQRKFTPVVGADNLDGVCTCATPNKNRHNRCRSCHRPVKP